MQDDIIYRLEKRAEIRRSISNRKSVQEGKPDRIAELLEEAAREILRLRNELSDLEDENSGLRHENNQLDSELSNIYYNRSMSNCDCSL